MDFITSLPILTDWKGDSYDSIFVIVNQLIKMVHYKLVKIVIDAPDLIKVIINIIIRYYSLPDLIVTNRRLLFTLKFWSSLYYFLGIKQKLFTAFHSQTDGQTKRQNSTREAHFQAFVNFEQNDWIRFFPIAEFSYNNAKNASTSQISF